MFVVLKLAVSEFSFSTRSSVQQSCYCDIIDFHNKTFTTDFHNKSLQYYQHVITTIESIMCLYGSGLNLCLVANFLRKCL